MYKDPGENRCEVGSVFQRDGERRKRDIHPEDEAKDRFDKGQTDL